MARKVKHGRRPKRKGRSQASLRRFSGNRLPRASILIACEGAETEPNYFTAFRRALKLSSVEVEIEGKSSASAPLRVVEFAIRKRNERKWDAKRSEHLMEYDEIWCVIDVENPARNTTFFSAICRAEQENIELAVSNPAFEYWYLCHYVETTRVFSDGQDVKRVLRIHIPDYSESKDVFSELYPATELAVERAKRIISNHPGDEAFPNPSTFVFKLVERLKKLASN
ncbi:RloB family protein [Chloroflexota bacterium]